MEIGIRYKQIHVHGCGYWFPRRCIGLSTL